MTSQGKGVELVDSLSLHLLRIVAGCCYKVLENPAVGRDKEIRGPLSSLLGLIVKKYHQNLSKQTG